MASVTLRGDGLTLQSSFRVQKTLDGVRVTNPVRVSGALSFEIKGLPAGAKVTEAYAEADFALSGSGNYTLAGRQATKVYMPKGPLAAMKNGMPVSVSVTWQAQPDGSEEGSVSIGRLYRRVLTVTNARLTLVYEGGGGGGGGGGEEPGQSGQLIPVKGPGRAGRGFDYFPEGSRDFSGNGLALRPLRAMVHGEENGDFSAELELLMEAGGAWEKIDRRGIIRMPAPARTVLVENGEEATESTLVTVTPSAERGYLYLSSKPSSTKGYALGRVNNGERMVLLESVDGLDGGTWYRVTWEERGTTGYCDAALVTVQSESADRKKVKQMQERDQLFRVEQVETDEGQGTMTVEARHIFYDLQKAVLIGQECKMENVPIREALRKIETGADHPLSFAFHTDCDGLITGDFRGQNVVEALMDPDGGMIAQVGGQLMRDNFDVYILAEMGSDRGVRIEHGRNCAGAKVNISSLATANRIVADMDGVITVHDDPNRGEGEEILAVLRKYKKEDGTAQEQAEKEFENGLAGVDFEMDVDFQLLSETGRYPQYAGLQKMYLGDQMRLRLRQGRYLAEMSGYTYDAILRRYDQVAVGATSVERSSGSVASYQMSGMSAGKLLGQVQGGQLAAGSITTDKLAAGSVTAEKLAAGAISADFIAAGSITADKLAAGVLSADLIAAGSITTEKLAAGSVTAEKLAAGAVSADFIAAGSITADKLAAGLITADSGLIAQGAIGTVQIADGSITDAKIVGLTASKITAGTINAADVNIINLKADNITAGTLNGMVIPVLGSEKIADGAVSGVKIQNGAVNTEKIEDGAVTAAKIVAEAVTADKIAANSVTANKILSGAVTADKIAANAVTADKIAANTITASKLAADVGRSLDLSSNTSLRLAVEDIQVGGENLLPDTRTMESWYARYAENSKPVTIAEDGEGFGVATWAESTVSVGAGLRPGSGLYLPFGPLENREVTLSFDWQSAAWQDGDALTLVFNVTDETGGTALCSRSMSLALNKAEKWQRVTLTVTLNEDFFTSYTAPEESSLFYIRFNNYRLAGCSIRRIQLEKGNKATDWGPAPSDGASTTAAILNRSGIRLKTGGTFQVDSRNFQIDDEGNVEMTGKVTAESGEVGGWKIAPGSLSSGEGSRHVRLSTADATYGIWAGAEGAQNAPFRVARDGSVYLTKLYVTDENGNAQAQPVNLRNNYWKVDKAYARAVKTLSVDAATNTLTIELFDGTLENFKKAVVSGVVNLAQAWNNGRLTITTDTDGITLSGDTTALVNGTPQNLLWGGENGAVATFDVTSDKGIVANQMQVDARQIYKNGYNACIDDCTYADNVFRISEYAPGTLYVKVGDAYSSVGSSWVKTTPASNLYAIPQKKT